MANISTLYRYINPLICVSEVCWACFFLLLFGVEFRFVFETGKDLSLDLLPRFLIWGCISADGAGDLAGVFLYAKSRCGCRNGGLICHFREYRLWVPALWVAMRCGSVCLSLRGRELVFFSTEMPGAHSRVSDVMKELFSSYLIIRRVLFSTYLK